MSSEDLSYRHIFQVLPIEVIHQIFAYVELIDLKMLRLTNHEAFNAAKYLFIKKVYICIDDNSPLDDISCLLQTGIQTVKIESLNFQLLQDRHRILIWKFLIDFCVDLEFAECRVEQDELFDLLEKMQHLTSLTLICMSLAYNITELMIKMITRLEKLHVNQQEPTYQEPKQTPTLPNRFKSTVREFSLIYWSKFDGMLYEKPTVQIFHELAKSVNDLSLQFDGLFMYETNWFNMFRFDLEVLRVYATEQVRVNAVKNLVDIVSGHHSEIPTNSTSSSVTEDVAPTLDTQRVAMDKLKLFQIVNQGSQGTEIIKGEKKFGGLDITNLPNLEVFHFAPGLQVELDTFVFSEHNSTKIKNLHMACNFSDQIILSIALNFKNLTHLHLEREFPRFPRYILRLIFVNMPNLEMINIQSSGGIRGNSGSNPGVTIKHLQKLKNITLHNFGSTKEIQFPLLRDISTLEKVHYVDCGLVTKAHVEDLLRSRPEIKYLHVTGHSLTPAEIQEVLVMFANSDKTIELLEDVPLFGDED